MTTVANQAISPIYFTVFDEYLSKLKDIEAVALLLKIQFHCKRSTIVRGGIYWYTRKKADMAQWFNLSIDKLDTLLSKLEKAKLVKCRNYKYKDVRQLHIAAAQCRDGYMNFALVNHAVKLACGLRNAIVFLRILYLYNSSKITKDGKKWCAISREELATWANISIRTLDSCLKQLEAADLIIKDTFKWRENTCLHFHVKQRTIGRLFSILEPFKRTDSTILEMNEKESKNTDQPVENTGNGDFCSSRKAKTPIPYNEDYLITPEELTTNTTTKVLERERQQHSQKQNCDMNFSTQEVFITKTKEARNTGQPAIVLSERDIKYIQGALRIAMSRDKLRVSNPTEFFEQLKFSVGNWLSNKKLSVEHAVNRAFKIAKDGNWRTPIGFSKHSPVGQVFKQTIIERERKEQEKATRRFDESDQRVMSFVAKIADFEARMSVEEDELKRSIFEMQISKLRVELFDLTRNLKEKGLKNGNGGAFNSALAW